MVHVGMKREREMDPNITSVANCLMILARGGDMMINPYIQQQDVVMSHEQAGTRVFECKTCNRQFPSFQALGGHRASHKKPRNTGDSSLQPSLSLMISSQQPTTKPKPKPKTHECSICGLEFAIGQALGGHMRRHRAATLAENQQPAADLSLSPPPAITTPPIFVPHVLKRSNSCKRICLDLNLTPKENGMDNFHQIMIRDQKVSPILHCYF